jgi:hypothetical protein
MEFDPKTGKLLDKNDSSSPALGLVKCTLCGKKNEAKETFDCPGPCGAENLCLGHQDPATYQCERCSGAAGGDGRDGAYIAKGGVVLDTRTNLEWKVGPDQDTNYHQAEAWIRSQGGGWRMPTRAELRGLYEPGKGERNRSPLFKSTGEWVWAEPRDASSAWYFFFNYGYEYYCYRDGANLNRVFGVRAAARR